MKIQCPVHLQYHLATRDNVGDNVGGGNKIDFSTYNTMYESKYRNSGAGTQTSQTVTCTKKGYCIPMLTINSPQNALSGSVVKVYKNGVEMASGVAGEQNTKGLIIEVNAGDEVYATIYYTTGCGSYFTIIYP